MIKMSSSSNIIGREAMIKVIDCKHVMLPQFFYFFYLVLLHICMYMRRIIRPLDFQAGKMLVKVPVCEIPYLICILSLILFCQISIFLCYYKTDLNFNRIRDITKENKWCHKIDSVIPLDECAISLIFVTSLIRFRDITTLYLLIDRA